jgi:hypothetical protein
VRAGPLEWDVEQTITHMLAATAKYSSTACQNRVKATAFRERRA